MWKGAGLLLFHFSVGALAVEGKGQSVDDYRKSLRDSKSIQEKALVIQGMGYVAPRDPALIPILAPFLNPEASDLNALLPSTAIATLSRFRGIAAASQALARSLPVYQRIPYLHRKAVLALGRVGHESGAPVLEGFLRGPELEAALLALQAIAEMPKGLALEVLFREWERSEQKKEKASPDAKKFHDQLAPEFLKRIKNLSGENYPTLTEFTVWWQKKGAAFKEKAMDEARSAIPDGSPAPTMLPPALLIELFFEETAGGEFLNTGASSLRNSRLTATKGGPARSISTSWGKARGGRSLDFGKKPGPHALDLEGPLDSLRKLSAFTLTCWVNLRTDGEGSGGSRIVSWLGPDGSGVEFVVRGDTSLQLGIHEPAAGSPARSPAGQVSIMDEKLPDAVDRNWRFVAVSYDSSESAGQVKFYAGSASRDAALVGTADYARGETSAKAPPVLSVGNVVPALRASVPDAMFRGLVDDFRLFDGVLPAVDIVSVQDRPPTPKKP